MPKTKFAALRIGGNVLAFSMDRNLLPFDATIVQYLNDKIGTFHELDTALFVLSGNPLAKGMLFMGALWWRNEREARMGHSASPAYSYSFWAGRWRAC
jgi:hypothetical protein